MREYKENKVKLCKYCKYFEVISEPIKGVDFGVAKCNKYNLYVDFITHKKFTWLSCSNRPQAESEG